MLLDVSDQFHADTAMRRCEDWLLTATTASDWGHDLQLLTWLTVAERYRLHRLHAKLLQFAKTRMGSVLVNPQPGGSRVYLSHWQECALAHHAPRACTWRAAFLLVPP